MLRGGAFDQIATSNLDKKAMQKVNFNWRRKKLIWKDGKLIGPKPHVYTSYEKAIFEALEKIWSQKSDSPKM